jgi:glycosyltransferase involved in cell wall biosynthesis
VHSSSRLLYTWPLLLKHIPLVMTYHRLPGRRPIIAANHLGRHLVFTGVSQFIIDQGRQSGGNWRCVYNCIDTKQLTYRPDVRADAPLVYLSRIDADKGAHLAIAIARKAKRCLVIAGNHSADTNAAKYWRELIEPQVDGKLIRYIGPVDQEQKNQLLGQARALLVPTQCDEAFGLVFAEALACGTPAISTPRGAVPEIIEDGKTGWLISNIEEGAHAVNLVASISRQTCRNTAEARFSIERTVTEYEKIYRELHVADSVGTRSCAS